MTRVCLKITNMTQNPCLAYLWGYQHPTFSDFWGIDDYNNKHLI
jgi:hypothetical protein